MIDLVRITTPIAALMYEETIRKSLIGSGYEGDANAAVNYIGRYCSNSALGLWVARHDLEPCGGIMCVLPTNPLCEYPEITMFANWGPREAGKLLMDQAVQHGWDAGYVKLRALNRTGRPDELSERLYRRSGRTITRLGTMFEFTEYPPEKSGDSPDK